MPRQKAMGPKACCEAVAAGWASTGASAVGAAASAGGAGLRAALGVPRGAPQAAAPVGLARRR
eukprot:13762645-Alexandrium_andersonii.AAC.1